MQYNIKYLHSQAKIKQNEGDMLTGSPGSPRNPGSPFSPGSPYKIAHKCQQAQIKTAGH